MKRVHCPGSKTNVLPQNIQYRPSGKAVARCPECNKLITINNVNQLHNHWSWQ